MFLRHVDPGFSFYKYSFCLFFPKNLLEEFSPKTFRYYQEGQVIMTKSLLRMSFKGMLITLYKDADCLIGQSTSKVYSIHQNVQD